MVQNDTPNSEYYVARIYHSPDPVHDPVDLLECQTHVIRSLLTIRTLAS